MRPRSTFSLMPEYVLNITRHEPDGSRRDKPVRVHHVPSRRPVAIQPGLYDNEGNLESQVTYSAYKSFGDNKFPTRVVIKRPLEGITIVLTVEKVTESKAAGRPIHRKDPARHNDSALAINRTRSLRNQTDPPVARPVLPSSL